jgi:hypothetical protein
LRLHQEDAVPAWAHEGSRVDICLASAGLDQSQWHVDAHRLDVVDGGQQCVQVVCDMRVDERAAV